MPFDFYSQLPWQLRGANPFLGIAGVIWYFHRLYALNTLELIGLIFCTVCSIYWLHLLYTFIYRNWVGVWLGHSVDFTKCGQWAVVTGATQGIGLAYAHALAQRGLNIVLLSRSPEKLSAVAQEVSEQHGVLVKIISMDFTTADLAIYEDVRKQLAELEVGLLINNVGICYPHPELFGDLPGDIQFCRDMINCNMLSVTLMTQLVLPGMMQRRKGVVVSVGSFSSVIDSPFLSLYSATKVFVDKLTSDLELEYKEYGILFQSVIPGYVVSNMSKFKNSSRWIPSAEEFTEQALNAVGLQKRTSVWVPHQLLHLIVKCGHFFRRDGASSVTLIIAKQFWLYSKKVMMYRAKKAQNKILTDSEEDENSDINICSQ